MHTVYAYSSSHQVAALDTFATEWAHIAEDYSPLLSRLMLVWAQISYCQMKQASNTSKKEATQWMLLKLKKLSRC